MIPLAVKTPDSLSLASSKLQPPGRAKNGHGGGNNHAGCGSDDIQTHCGYPDNTVADDHGLSTEVSRACDRFMESRGLQIPADDAMVMDDSSHGYTGRDPVEPAPHSMIEPEGDDQ